MSRLPMSGTMILDPCTLFGQDQIRPVIGMALAGAMIEPIQVGVGELRLSSPMLESATCPNLQVTLTAGFMLQGLFSLSGTLRLTARVTVRTTPINGGPRPNEAPGPLRPRGL